jgi:hypothetical protein
VCVDRVGLAAVAGGEYPHLRRQLRRHIQNDLAVVDQAVRDVLADAVAALNRPLPVSEPAPGHQHFRVTTLIGAEFSRHDYAAELLITSIVAERLCGSIPIITGIQCPRLEREWWLEA